MHRSYLTKRSWIWCLLATGLLAAFGRGAAAAKPKPVEFPSLTKDLQKLSTSKGSGSLTLVFWFPRQYWECAMANDKRIDAKVKAATLSAFDPYTVIAVIDAQHDKFGEASFRSKDEIQKNMTLVDANGNVYEPLDEDDIQLHTRSIMAAMQPVLAKSMGPMGKNLHLILFPAVNAGGKPIADPKSKGALVVKLDKQEFRWKLPLNSLVPPKTCAKCKEECSGAWDFCPWCGRKLSAAKP